VRRFYSALLVLAACRDSAVVTTIDATPLIDVGFIHDLSPSEPPDAGPPVFDGGDPSLLPESTAVSGKSVGHTSVVFKVKLKSGLEICFKPESKRGKTRYRGEIAAWRLAVALGLHNVIPAMPRTFDAAELSTALDANARELFGKEAVVRDGKVRGAAMGWLTKLEFLPLETPPWRTRFTGWLGAGDMPDDQRALAAQISNLLVFDLMTGNWDRWSGANVGIDRPSNTLLYVDNDGAFFDPPPPGPLAAQLAMVNKAERFSKSFVAALRKLEPIPLSDAIGEDMPGTALLSAKVLSGVDERRRKALAHIDELIAKQGEAAILCFP
jgi:hypothetical protein